MAPGDMNTKVSSCVYMCASCGIGKTSVGNINSRTHIYAHTQPQRKSIVWKAKGNQNKYLQPLSQYWLLEPPFVRAERKRKFETLQCRALFKNSTYWKTPLVIKWWMAKRVLKASKTTHIRSLEQQVFLVLWTHRRPVNWEINLIPYESVCKWAQWE